MSDIEKFSASQATKFMNCTASANLDIAIPNWVPPEVDPDADNAANRGTKMHEIFANVMELAPRDAFKLALAIEYVTMIRGKRRFKYLIEAPVIADWLASKPGTTADLVLYTQDELHVFDLKTGMIPVSPVENNQLMFYALSYGHLAPKATGAHLHIVQPWADITESWFADVIRLTRFKFEALKTEQDILNKVTVFNPGDHCTFCPANPHGRGARGKPFCPEMMALLYPQPPVDYDEILKGD